MLLLLLLLLLLLELWVVVRAPPAAVPLGAVVAAAAAVDAASAAVPRMPVLPRAGLPARDAVRAGGREGVVAVQAVRASGGGLEDEERGNVQRGAPVVQEVRGRGEEGGAGAPSQARRRRA